MAKKSVAVKLDQEVYKKIVEVAIEGNVSMWIRLLVMKEFERLENGRRIAD